MKIDIDAETKRVTTRCKKAFACLTENRPLCQVKEAVAGAIQYIQCGDPKDCSYQGQFGADCLCECPIRREVYSKYNL